MIVNSGKQVPEIRFKGFADAWEQRKLGEMVELFSGYAFSSNDSVNSGVRWLKIANVGSGFLRWDDESFLPDDYLEKYPAYHLRKGDFVMALTRPILNHELKIAQLTDSEALLNQRVAKLIFSGDHHFSYQLLRKRTTVDEIENELSGTDPPNLSVYTINSIIVSIPFVPEQTAIGNFFRTLDTTITNHQQKLKKLRQLKTAYMQQMFPQAEEPVPRVRFKGFSSKWTEVQLSKIAEKFDNLRVPITASERVKGNIPYYGANGIQDYVEGFTHDGEFILIAEDGASDLSDYPVNLVNGKIWVNNHAHVISGIPNIVINEFLAYSLKQVCIEPFLVGGTRAKLNADVMMKLNVLIAEIKEQVTIGRFFRNLDMQITVQNQKLNKLKQLKTTYLQKMFI